MVGSWVYAVGLLVYCLWAEQVGLVVGSWIVLRSRVDGLLFMSRTGWFSGRIVDCFTQ